MSAISISEQTDARRITMLHSAFAGPVRAAMAASDVTEILANADGSVWIERVGAQLERAPDLITANDRERIIRLVASAVGEPCDRNSPIVSAEIPGTGERFEGVLPPVSEAPCFAIRKQTAAPFKLDDYVEQGALSPPLGAALRQAISDRLNIIVAGGTSSGKTTFANALLAEHALQEDRIVVLEDTRELQVAAPDTLAMRTHRCGVDLRALVRSTMRLRPDRIIVGEVRGGEALDLLKAWNTGHPGGLTTLHANSAMGALTRLEQLIEEATTAAPYSLIGEAVDVIVFMSRASGSRRIEEAIRVHGFTEDGYQTTSLATPFLTVIN